jgi:hypothetical protein
MGFTIDDGTILPRPSKTKFRPFHSDDVAVDVVVVSTSGFTSFATALE